LHLIKENRMTGKKTALVQKLYAAFQRADMPTLLEHMTDDIDWGIEVLAPTGVPWHGTGTGKAFATTFFQALGKETEFSRFEPSDFLEGETSVSCLVTFEATMKRNGRKLLQHVIHHFTFRGDRVSRWRGWEDTAATQAAWAG
jgi:ketosteroid isomerase-like protein